MIKLYNTITRISIVRLKLISKMFTKFELHVKCYTSLSVKEY